MIQLQEFLNLVKVKTSDISSTNLKHLIYVHTELYNKESGIICFTLQVTNYQPQGLIS